MFSKVLGASWYLLSIERQEECWRKACEEAKLRFCHFWYFDCRSVRDSSRASWLQSSNVSSMCDPTGGSFQFGIYADALTYGVTSSRFFNKYFYCLWWGLRNLRYLPD